MEKALTVTPKKIQRLMHIAEDHSYQQQDDSRRVLVSQHIGLQCESSSGLLDLDNVEILEAMTESEVENNFLTLSTAFNPGEMTGRSTGADEVVQSKSMGRYSMVVNAITNEMDKQSHEVNHILRHSICNSTAYSFQSKRDLTADEASLVMREAPIPIQPSAQMQFPDSLGTNSSELSVGAYFQKRCSNFDAVMGKVDSPDRSMYSMPSISEVPKSNYVDESLDCVPVRQSRLEKIPEKMNINNPISKNYEKQAFQPTLDKFEKNNVNKTFNATSVFKKPPASNNDPYLHHPKPLNPIPSTSYVRHPMSAKPTDLLIRNLQANLKITSEETEESACPTDNSLSISKIADFLGKESNISISAMLQLNNHKKPKKLPLSELHMNYQMDKNDGSQVTSLSDSRKLDTASSAGTISTVIQADRLDSEVPAIVVSNTSLLDLDGLKNNRRSTRSKSPSSKSQSTLSTVQENYHGNSFKSGDSPLQSSKGDINDSHVPSPNIEYRELDKSVDWHEVLQQKRIKQQSLAKECWVEIVTSACNGFMGVSCAVNCSITTLTDSWLTAKLKFDVDDTDIIIEPPRLPLLSPGKTERFTFYVTSNIELNTSISYTVCLRDSSIDLEIEQKGAFDVLIKKPMIQAMSNDEVNKVTFPPIQEMCSLAKSIVLVSDCSGDLQLELSIVANDQVFSIKNVQEIAKSDVNKVLMEKQGSVEEMQLGKSKSKFKNRQLCRLSNGNAIRVTVAFNAPKLTEHQAEESMQQFEGALNVNLIGVNSVLRTVELAGLVGAATLAVKQGNKLTLTHEPTIVTLVNSGSVNGVWVVKAANTSADHFPFKVAPTRFDIRPGASKDVSLAYTGPEDVEHTATLVFEDPITCHKTAIKISGGSDAPKAFPIKTNHSTLSFIRPCKKEVNLKNSSSKKVVIRMMIQGDGFDLDLPDVEKNKGVYSLTFSPSECRTVTVVFQPASNLPYSANLHLVYDKYSDLSRNVRLYGGWGGPAPRWAGLVSFAGVALARAAPPQPARLDLYNAGPAPAFLAARVHFHLQYNGVSSSARLGGGRRVLAGRARHALSLQLDWARVERCARAADSAALADVTVLCGPELTRRRILRVIRDDSGKPDTSLLDDHLKVLADKFEEEDPDFENTIADFRENKSCLHELIGGLQILRAQVVLSQDYDNTVVVADDTVAEHHTLCD